MIAVNQPVLTLASSDKEITDTSLSLINMANPTDFHAVITEENECPHDNTSLGDTFFDISELNTNNMSNHTEQSGINTDQYSAMWASLQGCGSKPACVSDGQWEDFLLHYNSWRSGTNENLKAKIQ